MTEVRHGFTGALRALGGLGGPSRPPILISGLLALDPASAEACTWCVSSAFGDRTYGWPYLGLILAPFIVAMVVTAVLVHHLVGFREVARRLRGRLARSTSEGETA